MTLEPETPEQKVAWEAFLASPEFDALLEEALNDTSPKINLSKPGAIEALRKRLTLPE